MPGTDENAAHADFRSLGEAAGTRLFALGTIEKRRSGDLLFVSCTVDGTVGKRDSRASDFHRIKLRAQRLHDHAAAFDLFGVGKLFGNGILQYRKTFGSCIGERWDGAHFDLGLGVRLQKTQTAMFTRLNHGNGHAGATGASRTSDTVHVSFRRCGQSQIDHMREVF